MGNLTRDVYGHHEYANLQLHFHERVSVTRLPSSCCQLELDHRHVAESRRTAVASESVLASLDAKMRSWSRSPSVTCCVDCRAGMDVDRFYRSGDTFGGERASCISRLWARLAFKC